MGCVWWGGQIAGRRWGEGNWGAVPGDSAWNASACCRHLFIKPLTCFLRPWVSHVTLLDLRFVISSVAMTTVSCWRVLEAQSRTGLQRAQVRARPTWGCVGPLTSPCVWGVPAHTKCLTKPGHSELVPQRLPSSLFTFVLLSLSPAPSARA